MLLHDTYFFSSNDLINGTQTTTILVHTPLFQSIVTLFISSFGACFNFICLIRLWLIIGQYSQRRRQPSTHILAEKRYRFFLALISNELLLCCSSILSCLDQKFFFATLFVRYHLCAAHVLIWKFTLHFTPLLTIVILCRYHYGLKRNFRWKKFHLSTMNQFLCTDLSIVISFVLALTWSVDGLWLWGVANVKDFAMPPSIDGTKDGPYRNVSYDSSKVSIMNRSRSKLENLVPQQTICYLQTDSDLNFTVRIVHLIQADFLLLFFLYLIGLFLEIWLQIRLCCCPLPLKNTFNFDTPPSPSSVHERKLSIYILYIFVSITFTSLPFYLFRTLEIVADLQLTPNHSEWFHSRLLAQILLGGVSFKPILFLILFCSKTKLFKWHCYLQCYIPSNLRIIGQEEIVLSSLPDDSLIEETIKRKSSILAYSASNHHQQRFSLLIPTTQSKQRSRTLSNPVVIKRPDRSLSNVGIEKTPKPSSSVSAHHLENWLKLTNAIIVDNRRTSLNANITHV